MAIKEIIESLIFAADEPLTVSQLKELTGSKGTEGIREALRDMQAEYETSGIQMAKVGGGYQFRSHPDNARWVRKLRAARAPRLTRAMLETLAIIAYRQPVTRPEIEEIRGVDSGSTLRVLLERTLIRIVGKKEEPGRPLLYGTTRFFLEFFNLKDLKDLPTLKEFTELNEENAEEVELKYGTPEEAEEAVRAQRGESEEGEEAAEAGGSGDPPLQDPGAEEKEGGSKAADIEATMRALAEEQAAAERRMEEEDDVVMGALDQAMDEVTEVVKQHGREEDERILQEEAKVREKLGLTSVDEADDDAEEGPAAAPAPEEEPG